MKRPRQRTPKPRKHIFTAFVPYGGKAPTERTVAQLAESGVVGKIYLLLPAGERVPFRNCIPLRVRSLASTATMKLLAAKSGTRFALLVLHDTGIEFAPFSLGRLASVAESTGEGMLYCDYNESHGPAVEPHPLVDYQEGSIRDDFDFGSVVVLESAAMKSAAKEIGDRRHAGFYDLRLAIARRRGVFRIPEFLYHRHRVDARSEGARLFDYVDPGNRGIQAEMEAVAAVHLKKIGAFLGPGGESVDLEEGEFPVTASVVIPVRNRATTIGDAVTSALRQQAPFAFNVIVVDNHSTDGTTETLRTFALRETRLIHVIPSGTGLGIGGCWNAAVHHPACGRFAVQLDSDDLYPDESVLGRIVDTFRREKCAMVIGTYRITDFNLREIPPGVIDHREWTTENGRNNALRVNGFGAPRAFVTRVLREINFPDVSYGEDYAVGLAVSRRYRIGRIYDPIYLCRRWEGNSDADPDTGTTNAHNWYKDRVRTMEIRARRRQNTR